MGGGWERQHVIPWAVGSEAERTPERVGGWEGGEGGTRTERHERASDDEKRELLVAQGAEVEPRPAAEPLARGRDAARHGRGRGRAEHEAGGRGRPDAPREADAHEEVLEEDRVHRAACVARISGAISTGRVWRKARMRPTYAGSCHRDSQRCRPVLAEMRRDGRQWWIEPA